MGSLLIGDIGATNARFALLGNNGIETVAQSLLCCDYPSLEAAVSAFLTHAAPLDRPRKAALAVAAPVTGDGVQMTNLGSWSFSIQALQRALGLDDLTVINDFTANALGVPELGEGDRRKIGLGHPEAHTPIGVIGPGSGLGVSGLLPTGQGWLALAGEGGHATMAPASDRESAVLALLRPSGHVSAERVISGPGLVTLYQALATLDGDTALPLDAAAITTAARGRTCLRCREAVDLFVGFLGTMAGNLALTLGARGGVYIAGGIAPRLGPAFDDALFRQRFAEKGNHTAYLAAIPTYLMTHPTPAFLGLRTLLRSSISTTPHP